MQLCDPDVQSNSETFIFSACLDRIACCVTANFVLKKKSETWLCAKNTGQVLLSARNETDFATSRVFCHL